MRSQGNIKAWRDRYIQDLPAPWHPQIDRYRSWFPFLAGLPNSAPSLCLSLVDDHSSYSQSDIHVPGPTEPDLSSSGVHCPGAQYTICDHIT